MPLEYFNCPDGGKISIGDCMAIAGCRMVNEGLSIDRCVPLTILGEQTRERQYVGQMSVTELANDFLFHYLKRKFPYGTNPTIGAARFIGSASHYLLEKNPSTFVEPEVKVNHPLFHGTADSVSIDEWNAGYHVLTDYKIYASYSLRQLKGMTRVYTDSPDEFYQRATTVAGVKHLKGSPKQIAHWEEVSENADTHKEMRQLNYYRIGLERQYGYRFSRLEVCAIIRDYGAQARAIFDREIYRIEIPRMEISDEEFLDYTREQQDQQFYYLENNIEPPMCNDEARWFGRRCQSWCDVRDICRYGGENAVIVDDPEGSFSISGAPVLDASGSALVNTEPPLGQSHFLPDVESLVVDAPPLIQPPMVI